ncbi:MAG TPA: hypothetical protein PKW75_06020 [candidate division Zixibacteria bacterium]|nr:hypothetical protein [candidate division Zixibacteria bacterium]MDD4918888.1 hypothetical protein [candidate division Zixibacteria bacterium]MDM7973868.1 hypothetical protein [candidate division Zixibacteria bacterium]HOZ07825.1 hypothetical protein [candidate division Zixibacteria bacterium]HPM36012.1 hypothetical protein [candidate division Zixibacteria bacterium]
MRGLLQDTFKEMVERKLIWIYVAVTVIAVLMTIASHSMKIEINMNSGSEDPIASLAQKVAVGAMDTYFSFLVFLTVMGTAGLIPSMLVRGRAEYYLSKPVSRAALLLYKLFSIWAVYGATIVAGGLVTFLAFYAAWGFADVRLLYIFALNMAALFVWLSVTAFSGILTGSFAVSIMMAFVMWIAQVLLQYHEAVQNVIDSRFVTGIVSGLYYVLPKTSQLGEVTQSLALGRPVESWLPLWSSLLFAVVLVGITVAMFERKDY